MLYPAAKEAMNEKPISVRLNAMLESEPDSQAAFVHIPEEISQLFGQRGRIPVRVTINGHVFRTTLAPYGGRHYLGVNKSVRAAAGVQIGDLLDLLIEGDREPRDITPPDDLVAALEDEPAALEGWAALELQPQKGIRGRDRGRQKGRNPRPAHPEDD